MSKVYVLTEDSKEELVKEIDECCDFLSTIKDMVDKRSKIDFQTFARRRKELNIVLGDVENMIQAGGY